MNISRIIFDENVDLSNPADRKNWMKKVNRQFDELVGAINELGRTGVTGNRPTLTSSQVGVPYFDTTLGIPIWWDGAQWINAAGTPV